MIIGIALGIMVILSIFSVVLGSSFMSIDFETRWVRAISQGLSVETRFQDSTFAIDELEGMLVIITVIITLASLVGIRVLASGLSDASVKVITVATAYGGIWSVLSVLSISMIKEISLFGSLIYITLTIAYVVGIVQKHVGV